MIAHDRYTELLVKIIHKTITPVVHQIHALVYELYGLTLEEIQPAEGGAK